MSFSVGSLVKVRNREWVVLPGTSEELVMVRPLGGTDHEITGILTSLEEVEPASFALPDPNQVGDHQSCKLLRDALRIGFRSSAGPFRSFGRIAVEPRPYQIVPLLLGLKLDPVRLLIADDVGIGKTIEACLIARELLDRGEIQRIAVLCPPQIAEQWQKELNQKFHIDAQLVLTSTAARLEKNCRLGESLFEHFPFVVVSLDFIKSDRRRDEFFRTCPEFVIVDEAHTCAYAGERNRGKHQRHQLISGLADNPNRHIILTTATPHSGKETAFRSLLSLIKKDFINLPENLAGSENERHRRELAKYYIQRKRGDIKAYLGENTHFPERDPLEAHYNLTPEYKRFFDKVLSYARETVQTSEGGQFQRRVRWWSALALLRSLASSPAAAATTLRTRAAGIDTENTEEADEIGRGTVLDLMDEESSENIDITPGGDIGELAPDEASNRRKLLEMAREAEKLKGKSDTKLSKAIDIVKSLLKDDYHPIIFCRFIPTVEYVAAALRDNLPRAVEIAAITGNLPPAEREYRVQELGLKKKRVLVCTDCLSEGINLQDHFDAVMHYDLSWNPTRHEQREGRVDRFGQARDPVRVITYYGIDNQIDGIVLDVLIRKHKKIRSSTGISVPVPANTDQVIEAIFEGLLLREEATGPSVQLLLPGFEEFIKPKKEGLFKEWEIIADREKRSRTMFAQASINVNEVLKEIAENRTSIGSSESIEKFTTQIISINGGTFSKNGVFDFDISEVPTSLKDLLSLPNKFKARFDLPVENDEYYFSRTHPAIEALSNYVIENALDPVTEGFVKRCGVIRTNQVSQRTTLLLLRLRYHIISKRSNSEKALLAEDAKLVAYVGSPQSPNWLDDMEIDTLLNAKPSANILPDQASHFVKQAIESATFIQQKLNDLTKTHGEYLLDAHQRVRQASKQTGLSYQIKPVLPPDILGIYIFLPAN